MTIQKISVDAALTMCGCDPDAPYGSQAAQFRAGCARLGIFYYARPRESFSVCEAERLAAEAGATFLALEDLS